MPNPLDSTLDFIKQRPYVAVAAGIAGAGIVGIALLRKPEPEPEDYQTGAGYPVMSSVGTMISTYPAPAAPATPQTPPSPLPGPTGRRQEPNPYVCPRGTVAFTDSQGRQRCRSTKSGNILNPRIRTGGKWVTVKYE